MNLFEIIINAGHTLLQNKRRTILTMIGIIIGISSVITILSLGNGFEQYTVKSLTQSDEKAISVQLFFSPNDTGSGKILSNEAFFNQNDLVLLENVPGIQKATFSDSNFSNSSDETIIFQTFTLSGVNHEKAVSLVKNSGSGVTLGRPINKTDNEQHHRVAVIDRDLAENISSDLNSVLGFGLDIDGILYQVVGIMDSINISMDITGEIANVEIPQTTYQFLNSQNPTPYEVSITVDSSYLPSEVTREAIQALTDQGSMQAFGTYSSLDMSSLTDEIGRVLNTLTLFVSAIAGISLLIAGVGVMNMMYTTVAERTKEIGIRRSCGARRRDIRNQFLVEGLLLTILAGIIGYIIGFLIAVLISQFLPFKVSPDLFTISVALGSTIIIGLIFSIMPANQAARKDLVEILR